MATHDLADGASYVEAQTQELARRVAQFMDSNAMTTEAEVATAIQQHIDTLDGAGTTAQKIAAVSAFAKIVKAFIMSSIDVKLK